MPTKPTATAIVAKTLRQLITSKNKTGIASTSKVGLRSIYNYMDETYAPQLDKLDDLAKALKCPVWALMIDGVDSSTNMAELERLVRNYLSCDKGGREYITNVSENTAAARRQLIALSDQQAS